MDRSRAPGDNGAQEKDRSKFFVYFISNMFFLFLILLTFSLDAIGWLRPTTSGNCGDSYQAL
jgi:hypothetical protein